MSKVMATLGVFVLGAWFSFTAHAQTLSAELPSAAVERPSRIWSGEWKFELGGLGFNEGRDEGAASYTALDGRFEYQFSPWLTAKLNPVLQFYSSRVQERYDSEIYENRFRLDEGYLSLRPVSQFEFRAGAISQEFLENDMLISGGRAFPGFQEILTYDLGAQQIRLQAQQVIPTSYSLNTDRQEKEKLPSFQTQSLHVWNTDDERTGWRAQVGHFAWSKLPDKIASESILAGNTTNGAEAVAGSKFRYGFDGFFWGGELELKVSDKLRLIGLYQGVKNSDAPARVADAQTWGLGSKFAFGNRELEVIYRNYFIEPDATVGVYASSRLGHANRIGDNLEAKLDFKEWNFAVVGEWTNARTVRDYGTQNTLTLYYLGVETHYVAF